MELNLNDEGELIQILAMEVEQLLLVANKWIRDKAMWDEKKRERCKQVLSGGNVDKICSIIDELLH